jgi:N-acetylneuraminic acid mutarotase
MIFNSIELLSKCRVNKKIIFPIIFLIVFIVSCKKDNPLSDPTSILGPSNICPGETGITYSVNPIDGATYYLWTVPDDAQIISGQGTTSIVIRFGKTSGQVCVKSNNDTKESKACCIQVTQGGVSNNWCREMDFKGGGRADAVSFAIGNKGYIGTGWDATTTRYNDFWEFDPDLNTWTQKANVGGLPRFDAVGFAIGNKGYIGIGGNLTSCFSDFWEYDPGSNKWSQKTDFTGIARSSAFGFSIGNKGYIGAGRDVVYHPQTDFYEYDPSTDQWTQKANTVTREGATSLTIGNKGYIGCGSNGVQYFNDFLEFDPSDSTDGFDNNHHPLGKWITKAPFPGAVRFTAVGFAINNKGYIGTGYDGNVSYKDIYEYDPNTNTWAQKTDLGGNSRGYAVGFAIGKNGYIGTGNENNGAAAYDNDFWVYGQ